VKKAYENNPKIYTEFLTALEEYHGSRYGFSSYRVIGVGKLNERAGRRPGAREGGRNGGKMNTISGGLTSMTLAR